jgi:hypothetical protein
MATAKCAGARDFERVFVTRGDAAVMFYFVKGSFEAFVMQAESVGEHRARQLVFSKSIWSACVTRLCIL